MAERLKQAQASGVGDLALGGSAVEGARLADALAPGMGADGADPALDDGDVIMDDEDVEVVVSNLKQKDDESPEAYTKRQDAKRNGLNTRLTKFSIKGKPLKK